MIRIFLGLFVIGSIQMSVFGQCHDVKVKKNFDVNKYMGKWYEVERYNTVFDNNFKCVGKINSITGDGRMHSNGVQTSTKTGEVTKYDYYATIDTKEKAKMDVIYELFPSGPPEAPFWILETDYKSYAVGWSCVNNEEIVWVLTRSNNPTSRLLQKAHNVMIKQGLDVELLTTTDQSNCRYSV